MRKMHGQTTLNFIKKFVFELQVLFSGSWFEIKTAYKLTAMNLKV